MVNFFSLSFFYFIYCLEISAQSMPVSGNQTIHFVTKDGIQDELFPGLKNLPVGTYLSFVYDSLTDTFYFGFQGGAEYFEKHPLLSGQQIPKSWQFQRRTGHEDMIQAALPDYARNEGRFKGGGVILSKDPLTGEIFLNMRTRTRSIQGVRIERTQPVILVNRTSMPGFRSGAEWYTNGLLSPYDAKIIADKLSNAFNLRVDVFLFTAGSVANIKPPEGMKDHSALAEMEKEAAAHAEKTNKPARKFTYPAMCPILKVILD